MSEIIKTLFVGINHQSFLSSEYPGKSDSLPSKMRIISSPAENPDLVICVDVDASALNLVRSLKHRTTKAVLVVSEPSVVVPLNSHPRVTKIFDKTLQIGRPGHVPLLPWPQQPFDEPVSLDKSNSGKAILIQSRKYSFVKGQLYSLRVRLAASDKRVYVAGHGWTEALYRTLARLLIELIRAFRARAEIDWQTWLSGFKTPLNILGPVESKKVAMQDFKVAVVIENSQEYMSEKLFDAFVGGCIPVYVGPDLEVFGIPSSLYVTAEATPESVQRGISVALDMDFLVWRQAVMKFLMDEETMQLWGSNFAVRRVLDAALDS